jgi:hypothetical protein
MALSTTNEAPTTRKIAAHPRMAEAGGEAGIRPQRQADPHLSESPNQDHDVADGL